MVGIEGGLRGYKTVTEEMNMANLHCRHAWQCYSEASCFDRLIYTSKNHNQNSSVKP